MRIISLILISCSILFFSCKKESFITSADARITVTADTLKYDTVFVASGSIYEYFKIINENNQKLKLTSVRLMGGAASAYKINVDGTPGPEVDNLDLEANDSLYVFVQVNVDQNAANLPFVVRDSIQISFNGNTQLVQLEAWGKNAHFFRNKIISANETWNNDLPYVILGSLTIDPGITLTINKGCHIYLHADAPVFVDGSLQVNGLKDTVDRVYFLGDRLDDPYKDFPAAWPGIYFSATSKDNIFNYAVIKNSFQSIAVQDPSTDANPKITLNECIIDNSYDAGIIAVNSSISARNCLVSNCGKNLYLVEGGNYQFVHCTAASFSNDFIQHKDQVLYVSNYVNVNNVPTTSPLNATFTNCIFWGDGGIVDNEVVVDINGTNTPVIFNYGLFKAKTPPANATLTQMISNQDPQFDSINISKNYYDFRLKAGSPAIDKGVNTAVITDLDGNTRPVGLPDLGCFEKQ